MPNTNSFYESIMNDAQSLMEKQASADPEVLSDILSGSDLSEGDLQKIASQLDQMLQEDPEDIDDEIDVPDDDEGNEPTPDESLVDDGAGDADDADADGEEQTASEEEGSADEGADADDADADDADADDADDADEADEADAADGEEQTASEEDMDFAKLAAHYDDLQEKYASAGLGVADYAYNQMGNPDDEAAVKMATLIGEKAEKLAYVAEISPYAVADDLLMAVAGLVTEEEDNQEE